jgi:hypothetical protein
MRLMRKGVSAVVRLVGCHRGLAVLVLASALVRAATAVAYWPGILVADSYTYIPMAFSGPFVGVEATRPSGYPILLHAIGAVTGSRVAAVSLAGQAMGIALGVLAYAFVLRVGGRRPLALVVAGAVLLEAELVVLGEYVMPEMTFALLLLGSAFLVASKEPGPVALEASGALLGAAATVRTAGLFAIPVWLAYVAWRHRRLPQLAAAVAMLALPLGGYLAWYHDRTGVVGLTAADGWFLYGRVAELADCSRFEVPRDERPLCRRVPPQASREGPAWYVFSPSSPARRAFGTGTAGSVRNRRANRILRSFALSVIRSRPAAYADLVAKEFARFFTSTSPRGRFPFPDKPIQGYSNGSPVASYVMGMRARYVPGYVPRAGPPAAALHDYADVVTLPPIGAGLLAATALLALALAIGRRGSARVPSRAVIALLAGMALSILLGSVATSDYNARYMTPVMPLLIVAGGLAGANLAAAARRRSDLRGAGAPHQAPYEAALLGSHRDSVEGGPVEPRAGQPAGHDRYDAFDV